MNFGWVQHSNTRHALTDPLSYFGFDADTLTKCSRESLLTKVTALRISRVNSDDAEPGCSPSTSHSLTASVCGSAVQPYVVTIDVSAATEDSVSITSSCTCPMKFNKCKHICAAWQAWSHQYSTWLSNNAAAEVPIDLDSDSDVRRDAEPALPSAPSGKRPVVHWKDAIPDRYKAAAAAVQPNESVASAAAQPRAQRNLPLLNRKVKITQQLIQREFSKSSAAPKPPVVDDDDDDVQIIENPHAKSAARAASDRSQQALANSKLSPDCRFWLDQPAAEVPALALQPNPLPSPPQVSAPIVPFMQIRTIAVTNQPQSISLASILNSEKSALSLGDVREMAGAVLRFQSKVGSVAFTDSAFMDAAAAGQVPTVSPKTTSTTVAARSGKLEPLRLDLNKAQPSSNSRISSQPLPSPPASIKLPVIEPIKVVLQNIPSPSLPKSSAALPSLDSSDDDDADESLDVRCRAVFDRIHSLTASRVAAVPAARQPSPPIEEPNIQPIDAFEFASSPADSSWDTAASIPFVSYDDVQSIGKRRGRPRADRPFFSRKAVKVPEAPLSTSSQRHQEAESSTEYSEATEPEDDQSDDEPAVTISESAPLSMYDYNAYARHSS